MEIQTIINAVLDSIAKRDSADISEPHRRIIDHFALDILAEYRQRRGEHIDAPTFATLENALRLDCRDWGEYSRKGYGLGNAAAVAERIHRPVAPDTEAAYLRAAYDGRIYAAAYRVAMIQDVRAA